MNKKYFIISSATVFVQYYDYLIFGFLAAKIAPYFFPSDENIIQLLNTYLILALAMIAKPIGSIILGKIGDREGRPASFRLSLIGTAIASLILFACPSFDQIDYLAIFLLTAARMLVCACVTSGSDGVRLFIYENIEKHRQCYGVGVTALFTQAGTLMAALVALVVTFDYMPEYLWKFSFLLGTIMSLLVLYMMAQIGMKEESKVKFTKENDNIPDKVAGTPLIDVIKDNFTLFITCSLLAGAMGSTNQFLLIFFGTYHFEILKTISKSEMKLYIVLAVVTYMISSVFAGILADKFGKSKIFLIGLILCISASIVQAFVMAEGKVSIVLYILIMASLPLSLMPAAVKFKQAIPIAIRYRIFSLSHAVGSILISAPTAYLSTLMYHKTLLSWAPFCYFIFTLLMISLALFILKTRTRI